MTHVLRLAGTAATVLLIAALGGPEHPRHYSEHAGPERHLRCAAQNNGGQKWKSSF